MSAAPDKPVTRDAVLGGRVALTQAQTGYRVSVDAVFLAASVDAQNGDKVLDVGCGDGGATLCLAWRAAEVRVHGIDLREDAIARCRTNIAANEWSERVSAVPYDVAASPGAGLSESFDWVMSNPPYLPASRMDQRKSDGVFDPATTETVPLAAWVSFMVGCAKDGGQLALVHRADRIEEVLAALAETCGDINIFPLWPKDDVAAKRIIVIARKAAFGPSCLYKGMVLHRKDGSFTSAAQAVLQDGVALDLN